MPQKSCILVSRGQTVPNFEILRALYFLQLLILPTRAPFQLEIPMYLSRRIFFWFSKMASHFFQKKCSCNFFLKTMKNHLRIPIHLHFWQKGFFKILKFEKTPNNKNFKKNFQNFKMVWKFFFLLDTKWWIHTKLHQDFCWHGKLTGREIKIQTFFIFHFFAKTRGPGNNWNNSPRQIRWNFESKRCPSR